MSPAPGRKAARLRGPVRRLGYASAVLGSADPGVLSLDIVERGQLDEAASFVVDLLERPGSDIRVIEGQPPSTRRSSSRATPTRSS